MTDTFRVDPVAFAQYVNAPGGDVARMLAKDAVKVTSEAKRITHQPGTGRTYVRSNPRRVHRASAPGQPFATDLGTASASINWAIGKDAVGIFAQIGSGLRKFRWLELGTRRMAPRPTLRRALRVVRR